MKHWLYSIVPTLIMIVLIVQLDSFLGLLHFWALVLLVIVILASYYIPYKLIEGEDRSSFYAFVCCIFVLYCAFKLDQHHRSGLKNEMQEICGLVANRMDDDLPRVLWRKSPHLYQFDILAGEQGIIHFRKKSHAPRNGEAVCVQYVDGRRSWLYAEHMIFLIH